MAGKQTRYVQSRRDNAVRERKRKDKLLHRSTRCLNRARHLRPFTLSSTSAAPTSTHIHPGDKPLRLPTAPIAAASASGQPQSLKRRPAIANAHALHKRDLGAACNQHVARSCCWSAAQPAGRCANVSFSNSWIAVRAPLARPGFVVAEHGELRGLVGDCIFTSSIWIEARIDSPSSWPSMAI